MMPKPGMTAAPAGNANPDSKGGSPMVPSAVPPPIDMKAGGPTAPFNIDEMLQTNRGDAGGQQPPAQQGPQRRALPPWGDSQGAQPKTGADLATAMGADGTDMADPLQGDPSQAGAMGPMVMLRLLKSLGRL